MDQVKAYLIDRDGVLTAPNSGAAIAGAVGWLNMLQLKNKPFLIATNHTTSGPEKAVELLNKRGFSISLDNIHTPLSILKSLFRSKDPGKVLVLGTGYLKKHLKDNDVDIVDSVEADTVLMGFNRHAEISDFKKAVHAVYKNNAEIIALHDNRLFKDAEGFFEPGLGAWVHAIEYATGRNAFVVGKPSEYYYSTALRRLGVNPGEVVMISDDPLSDLGGAKKMGIITVFVKSGKYDDPAVLNQLPSDLHPDYILEDITQVPLR